jgi:hypothetical protein
MGLKKYSDFSKDDLKGGDSVSNNSVSSRRLSIQNLSKPRKNLGDVIKSMNTPQKRDNRDPHVSKKSKLNLNFNGKVVKFLDNFKPSLAYSILESNNYSKDDIHFMIIEQTDESLLILKYNEKHDLKLKEFIDNLISYYRRNSSLNELFSSIEVEGNDTFSIIKNIPTGYLNGNTVIKTLNDDLMKLLKDI